MKHKRNNPTCYPLDSQGMKKNTVSIYIAFSIGILIRSKNITSQEYKTEKPFEIIVEAG